VSTKRKLVWAFVALIALYLVYPSIPSVESLTTNLASTQAQTIDYGIKTQQAQDALTLGGEFAANLEAYRLAVPNDPLLAPLIDDLSQAVARSGMRWTSGAPGALEQADLTGTYRTWQMSVTLQGPASSLDALLDNITQMDRLLVIDSITVRYEGPEVVVSLNTRFFALPLSEQS
jgi:hypothetical protein